MKGASLLPLFVNAEVPEISASFADMYYNFWKKCGFWKDLEGVGPQLTTLRLEITEDVDRGVAKLAEKLFDARLQKGMPLTRFEVVFKVRMKGTEKTKKLWGEFPVGLDIDQYLVFRRLSWMLLSCRPCPPVSCICNARLWDSSGREEIRPRRVGNHFPTRFGG